MTNQLNGLRMGSVSEKAINFSGWCAIFLIFSIPVSNAFTLIFMFILLGCWLMVDVRVHLRRVFSQVPSMFALGIFALFVIGAFYTEASDSEVFRVLRKMSRLLLIPLLIPYFLDERWRTRAYWAFIASLIFTLSVIYFRLGVYFPVDIISPKTTAAFRDPIYTSLFFAFGVFFLLHQSVDTKQQWVLNIPLILSFCYYLFFVNVGRAGQIIVIGLIGLFIIQRLPKRNIWLALSGLLGVMLLLLVVPSKFQERMYQVAEQTSNYFQGKSMERLTDPRYPESSIGLRLEFVKNSMILIQDRPIIGWGTGGFEKAYAKLTSQWHFDNPHNQYLQTMVQLGGFGLVLLIGLFVSLIITSFRLPKREQYICQGVVLSMAIGCLANSWLHDFPSMMFFVGFSALCLGAGKTSAKRLMYQHKQNIFQGREFPFSQRMMSPLT